MPFSTAQDNTTKTGFEIRNKIKNKIKINLKTKTVDNILYSYEMLQYRLSIE